MSAQPAAGEPLFPAEAPRTGWRRRGDELAERVAQLTRRVSEVVGAPPAGAEPAARPAPEVVSELTAQCVERLRTQPGPRESALLGELASDLQGLALELYDHEMGGRTRRIAACERGLSRLRTMTTSAGLIDGVCDELVRSCGFTRTMLARVEDGYWKPWKANASMRGESWLPAWLDRAIPLDELTLETQLLTERRPALITDTSVRGVHQMVHEAEVRSYVVAPIMPGGKVVGFFHADHSPTGRQCDVADREVLWTFADGFGHLYERTSLFEQLRTQREQVRVTLGGVDAAMKELTEAELALAAQTDAAAPVAQTAFSVLKSMSPKLDELTPRELEVLELIVAGSKNQEIADRLVISQATVKSHVKRILAKLGAVNRSQAIAHYLGVTGESA